MKISVITPSYNQANFITETINSVVNNGFKAVEYIVIDGGSTDGTQSILREYDSQITYWVSEQDNGQTHAINKGISRSTGEIICYLNSDDILMPGALESVESYFRNNPNIDCLIGDCLLINAHTEVFRRYYSTLPNADWMLYDGFPCVAQQSCFWRKSVSDRIGPFDETYHFCMDTEYWLRMLEAGVRFGKIRRFLSGYRWHDDTKGALLQKTRAKDHERLLEKYGHLSKYPFLRKEMSRINRYLDIGPNLINIRVAKPYPAIQ